MAASHVLTGMGANVLNVVPLPRIAHFCPTWICDQQCEGCSVWSREPEEELSTDQIIKMFDQLQFLDVVKMVGGEPFSRADLTEISRHLFLVVNPYIFQIVTNGANTDRILDFVKEVGSPRLHIRVSLSGTGENHERLSKGSNYKTVHDTLIELARLKKQLGFGLGINFRISDETVDDLKEVFSVYRPLGIDVVPGVHYSPFLQETDVYKTEFKSHSNNPDKIISAMKSIPLERGNMSFIERILLDNFTSKAAQRQLLQNSGKHRFGCRELRNIIYILPDGSLIKCGLRQKPVANLAKEEFNKIWYSSRLDEERNKVDQCPGCPQAAIEIFSRLYLGPFQRWFM